MHLLAQASTWKSPFVDYHALAPEIVVVGVICVLLVADLLFDDRRRWATSTIAGWGLLGGIVPVVTLAISDHATRSMFDGAYVVDRFSLVMKALFLIAGYLVVLMSTTYIDEGDYYQGEYYFLLLSSVCGMMMMASSRDLISMFVALEFLSIPAYMMAAWRKRDPKSNEAGVKYFLLGVFASALMLYGMSLLYGVAKGTKFTDIAAALSDKVTPLTTLSIVFVVVGFAFKVSAVPFHTWAPDTYEGAPTPVTAFLSVASKAAGFVAMLELLFVAFFPRHDVWSPLFWVLAAATMTLGNLVALRQTNIVRMLAYSSVAQGGFILMPLAVIADNDISGSKALSAVVTYLIIYMVTNLGAFAVVMAVARKTRSGEISSFSGLFSYAPGLTVAMTFFMFSLAGIPPLGGWFAKFKVFEAMLSAGGGWAVGLGVVGALNSVIALYYYANIARQMWFNDAPDGDTAPIKVPANLVVSIAVSVVGVVAFGVYPAWVTHFSELPIISAIR